ncbi:hypothetical protein [Nonlabens sp.]|uniref:hypothetical protein n=1 Tax=Nonlabens sp. TaxID=1888209 RepID=UPI0032656C68
MELTRHCDLCEHKKSDFKLGLVCSLTSRKPAFNKTCSKILLRDNFEEKLKQINLEYDQLNRKRLLTYSYTVGYILIGFIIIATGYLIAYHINDVANKTSVRFYTYPLTFIAISFAPMGMAISTLINYLQHIKVAKSKKEDLDSVLELYNIKYAIDIDYQTEFHGTQEVYIDLKVQGVR